MKVQFQRTKILASRGRFLLLALLLLTTSLVGILSVPRTAHAAIGSVTSYTSPLSGESLSNIGLGPDNNIWYTASGPTTNTYIGNLTTSGSFTQYGNRTPNSRYPGVISKGSDGNMWYVEQYTVGSILHYRIVQITTTGTVLGQYNLPSDKAIDSMTVGSDGALWFSESGSIGKITTAGVITENLAVGFSVTTGPDGNVWFAYSGTGAIDHGVGKVTPSGTSTRYPIPYYYYTPNDITTGPDGNLWFTEPAVNKIGKITTAGAITQYSTIPTTNSMPQGITTGSDGALWFVEAQSGKIGRITTSGTVIEYSVPGASAGMLHDIITGPDGAVWFLKEGNTIERMATELTNQTISFTSTTPSNAQIDGPKYTPVASASSGLSVAINIDASSSGVCSLDGSGKVSFQTAGTCTIDANQAGNADYNPAPQVQQSFTVLPVDAETSATMSCSATANVGDTVTCTITATNNGPAAATNATLTALVPNTLSGVSVIGGTLSGQEIIWTSTSFASGASHTITLNGTASAAGKSQFSSALLQTSPDPNNSNNIANSTITISD